MKVYAYFIPDLNAIKVGKGQDPEQRMRGYCKVHGLTADEGSLAVWAFDSDHKAREVERAIHRFLLDNGAHKLEAGNGAREVFHLGGKAYDEAVAWISRHLIEGVHGGELVSNRYIDEANILDRDINKLRRDIDYMEGEMAERDQHIHELSKEELRLRRAVSEGRIGFSEWASNAGWSIVGAIIAGGLSLAAGANDQVAGILAMTVGVGFYQLFNAEARKQNKEIHRMLIDKIERYEQLPEQLKEARKTLERKALELAALRERIHYLETGRRPASDDGFYIWTADR